MRGRLLVLGLLVSAPLSAQAPTHSTAVQSGFQHAGAKAFYSAGVFLVLREGLGMKKLPAALVSTVGLWAASKGWMAVRHPDWIGPWSAGDFFHDVLWHSALVVPIAIGPRAHPWRAGLAIVGLGVGIMVSRSAALPRW